ncbi:tetratricopeptide repeat protein [Streptomyces sp. NPDC047043]|uniref:tetratricopeptide repeat protein n=1 Tax=Streptomyces sp. NPDC047043 TaxID=3154497 RepID=UPI0033E1B3D0
MSERQVVRAANGFAYGCIGADIHVFGDGTPVYLLFARHAMPVLDSEWMRAQPSRMLDARAEIVDFTGRGAEHTELLVWRDAEPRLAVRYLYGEGGQGKTRLAARLARDSERAGWLVVDAAHGTDTHPPAEGSQNLDLRGKTGLLLLVDYADRWPLTDLSWLFHNTLLRREAPVRVLLVGRSVGGWPALRDRLDRLRENIDTSDQLLAPLPGDGPARADMFAVARDSFTRHYAQAPSVPPEPPQPLDAPEFGLTLAVHMAALVAVDAAVSGRSLPTDMVGLTTYLLDREQENWRQLYENADRGLDHRTSDRAMARAVFAAVLAGPAVTATATDIIGTIMPQASAPRLLTDHATCYPSADPGTGLQPMLPDRLAEDFLALMVPGHAVSAYSPDPWTVDVAETLLSRPSTAACAPRALTFLASATDRWPHVGSTVLYPLLTGRPQAALEAGSPTLSAIAGIGLAADRLAPELLAVLEVIEPLLPEGSHVNLDVGTLDVLERLTAHRLTSTCDPAQRAWLYGTLGRRRSNAGRWAQALEADQHAARINQQLADDDPRYRPHLAMALNNLASALSHNGRSREALTQARRSVALHRQLARDDRRERSSLALSLRNLGSRLAEEGMTDQAVTAIREGVTIRRELVTADPAQHLPDLVADLNNLSNLLGEQGSWEETEAMVREAVEAGRHLVEVSEAEYLPLLAGTLTGLGRALLGLGHDAQALAVTQEAAELYRRLASANPATYRPDLVRVLLNLSTMTAELDRGEEALEQAEEALGIARQAAEDEPELHRGSLVAALDALGDRLDRLGRGDDALTALADAVAVFERGPGPSVFDHDHMRRMHRLAGMYADAGDHLNEARLLLNLSTGMTRPHAIDAARRAAEIYRREGRAEDEAAALINLSMLLSSDDLAEATEHTHRAIALFRETGNRNLEAAGLVNLSSLLQLAERYPEALAAAEQANAMLGDLGDGAEGNPLFQMGTALLEAGQVEEAITSLQRAATAYRDKGRGEYEESGHPWGQADTLRRLADALVSAQRFTEAAEALGQAAEGFDAIGNTSRANEALLTQCATLIAAARHEEAAVLAEQLVNRYRAAADRAGEAKALGYLASARIDAGLSDEALRPCEEAVAIFGELDDPRHMRHEAAALFNLGKILDDLGLHERSGTAYEQAALKWREIGSPGEEHSALYRLGTSLFQQYRHHESADAYQRAVEICRRSGDRHAEAKSLFGVAAALVELGRLGEASAAAGHAAAQFQALGDQHGHDAAMDRLAAALHGLGRSQGAVEPAAAEAAAAFRRHGDRHGEALTMDLACAALLEAQRWDQAVSFAERALTVFAECADAEGEGEALIHLGLGFAMKREHAKAIDAYERAVGHFRETGRADDEARALHGLGEALSRAERHDEAVAANRRCAGILNAHGKHATEGLTLLNLCDALERLDRFTEIVPEAHRAVTAYTKAGDRAGKGKALIRLGRALAVTGATDEYVAVLDQAARIFEETGAPADEARARFELGAALLNDNVIDAPIIPLERAAVCYARAGMLLHTGIVSLNLGTAYKDAHRLEESLAAYRQAAEVFAEQRDPEHEHQALGRLGAALLEAGRYSEAIPPVRRTIAICQRLGARTDEGMAQLMLGAMLTDLGQLEDGATASRRAAELFLDVGRRELAELALGNLRRALDRRDFH